MDINTTEQKLYTTADAAVLLGCRPNTVSLYCRKYGIGRKHGHSTSKSPWLLTEEDIAFLRNAQAKGFKTMRKFSRAVEQANA